MVNLWVYILFSMNAVPNLLIVSARPMQSDATTVLGVVSNKKAGRDNSLLVIFVIIHVEQRREAVADQLLHNRLQRHGLAYKC
jgi:hypothetical protein